MRTEVPVLRRCCCCLPLRRGLIAWGYFKLVFALLILINFLELLYRIIHDRPRRRVLELIVIIAIIVMMILDAILHILFLIGAHKKETKFLRVYYFYSLIILVLTMLFDFICAGFMIKWYIGGYFFISIILIPTLIGLFLNLLVHTYIILLVRSEMIKLNNLGSFRFVNNAAEADCNLQLEQEYEVTDKLNAEHEECNKVVV